MFFFMDSTDIIKGAESSTKYMRIKSPSTDVVGPQRRFLLLCFDCYEQKPERGARRQ